MGTAAKPNIVLLGQKDPNKPVELGSDEGPFESWLAVMQDLWGVGNLTPFDTLFASRAISCMAPTQGCQFGAVCFHLGKRLFTFNRESGIWIDAFEEQPALSRYEKRPKDKMKFVAWAPGKKLLGSKRMSHIAVLSPTLIKGEAQAIIHEAATALKPQGQLFLADQVRTGDGGAQPGHPRLHSEAELRAWLEEAGLRFYSTSNMAADLIITLLRGLHSSLNMLANLRRLDEPWRGQRFQAFERELERAVTLHQGMERGEVGAVGLLYTKP